MHDKKILNEQLISSTVEIAKEAGQAITEIYSSDFDFQLNAQLSFNFTLLLRRSVTQRCLPCSFTAHELPISATPSAQNIHP